MKRSWAIAVFAVLVAMVSLYVREFQSRQKAQAKLQAALLQLNDARNEASAVAAKQREVEYDNFEKEKKIAELSKEVHELKMSSAKPVQPAQA